VLDHKMAVLTEQGADVSVAFLAGAETARRLVQHHQIRLAVLKARSPSCGNQQNYDGTFTGTRVPGEGVTAAALRRLGVQVFNEEQLPQAQHFLAVLDAESSRP